METFDGTNEAQVINRLSSSKTKDDWNKTCNLVKQANNGGYPSWWYAKVVKSGLPDKTFGPGAGDIKIMALDRA